MERTSLTQNVIILVSKLFGIFPIFKRNYIPSMVVLGSLTVLTAWTKGLHMILHKVVWYKTLDTCRGPFEVLIAWAHLYKLWKDYEDIKGVIIKVHNKDERKILLWVCFLFFVEPLPTINQWIFIRKYFSMSPANAYYSIILLLDDMLIGIIVAQFYSITLHLASEIPSKIADTRSLSITIDKYMSAISSLKLVNKLFTAQNVFITVCLCFNLLYYADRLRAESENYIYILKEESDLRDSRYFIIFMLISITKYLCLIFMFTRPSAITNRRVRFIIT